MLKLVLLPGPVLQLTRLVYDEEPEITDVTAKAHAYLYRELVIAPDVSLSDVLGLLHACPTLIDIYSDCCAQALADEASLGPLQSDPNEAFLECLELRRCWDYDTSTRSYSGLGFVNLLGLGPFREEDLKELKALGAERPQGLQQWCVSLTPVRDLLALPVRLNYQIGQFIFCSKVRTKPKALYCSEFLLGEVLHGLLSKLSWFGDPEQQQDMSDILEQAQSDPDGWTPLSL